MRRIAHVLPLTAFWQRPVIPAVAASRIRGMGFACHPGNGFAHSRGMGFTRPRDADSSILAVAALRTSKRHVHDDRDEGDRGRCSPKSHGLGEIGVAMLPAGHHLGPSPGLTPPFSIMMGW